MLNNDTILKALAHVAGPDGKTPLPDSGAIAGLSVRGDKVFIAINVAPDAAKALEPMRAGAEAAIRAVPGVASALVTLTAESAGGQQQAAPRPAGGRRRARASPRPRRLPR